MALNPLTLAKGKGQKALVTRALVDTAGLEACRSSPRTCQISLAQQSRYGPYTTLAPYYRYTG